MRKESFKTILLAALVVLSIALTRQLWMSIPVTSVIPSSKEADLDTNGKQFNNAIDISDVINPQSFTINFGGVNHTVLFSDSHRIWKEIIPMIKGYFEDGVTVEEITPERWVEIHNVRAIQVNFGYSMPMGVLRNIAQGKETGIYGKISAVSGILIPISEDGLIYIWDKSNGKFYKAVGSMGKEKIAAIIDQIEEENSIHEREFEIPKYDYYYSIKVLFDVNNHVLVPLHVSKGIPEIKVVNEIDTNNLKQVDAFASTFFGENFDFVKKIIGTNNSITYMYGYGRKVLKVDAFGGLEYVEELDGTKALGTGDLGESVKAAVHFVLSHEITPSHNIYLRDIKIIEKDKKKGYLLLFTNRINGLPVYVKDNRMQAPIEIEVFGKQVTYFKRFLTREKIDISFIEDTDNLPMLLTPQEALVENFNTIKNNMGISGEESKVFNEILASIRSVELCYYDYMNGDKGKLVPVWRLQLGEDIYFFDGYKGKIISRFKG